jgi:HK97 family phage prohead protease
MGKVAQFARRTWDLFTLSNAAAAYRFSQPYTPMDDLWREMFLGGSKGPVTREQLLANPVGLRARDMICNVATLPLCELDESNRDTGSELFRQFDPAVPNVVHLTQTFEDLFADAISWWEITEWDADDYPLKVRRRSDNNVTLNPPNTKRGRDPLPGGYDPREAVLYVDGRQVPARRMIRFDSPKQAARKVMWRTLARATALDEAATMYANDPRPADYFTPKPGMPDPASDGEVQTLLGKWRRWRKLHSTGYVPYALDYHTVDVPTPVDLQLVELQERVSLELAIAFGLDPSDVGARVQSMTYANVTDKRQDRINDVLAYFMRAVVDRLNMDDVTRPGRLARFDLDDYMRPDPKTRAEVAQIYVSLGVIGPDWVAAQEGLPPAARAGARPVATPAAAATGSNVVPIRATAARFADAAPFTFQLNTDGFTVDPVGRTISGIAIPYGKDKIAKMFGRRWRFAPGGARTSELSRIKLLEDHNPSLAFGHVLTLFDTPQGLRFTAKVGRGVHGDKMLALAQDKVKDGISVGVDFTSADVQRDPDNPGVMLITGYDLFEISQTGMPRFDDARITRVAAARTSGGNAMHCPICGQDHQEGVACPTGPPPTDTPPTPPAPVPAPGPAHTFASPPGWRWGTGGWEPAVPDVPNVAPPGMQFGPNGWVPVEPAPPGGGRPVIDPAGAGPGNTAVEVREALPYQFSRTRTARGEPQFAPDGEHNFHADLLAMSRANDDGSTGGYTDPGKRVMALMKATFDVDSADVNELNMPILRPDMFVDEREYRRPIWDAIGRGAPPNGVQPFTFPKYSSATVAVAAHTEGTEPASGTYVATNQTVTPGALSGKASLTREVWDMGGNPATASLVYNKLVRSYNEGVETAAATFLNTLAAAADITLGVAPTDAALVAAWEAAVADLQFIRGYNIDTFVLEKVLYKAFAAAKATDGRPFYPVLGPTNVNGQAAVRFQTLDLSGVIGIPSWALASTPGALNNSWLFDPATVFAWATSPQRLEFPGTAPAGGGAYAPVAMVDIAAWGYTAFANTDIGGVRQVTYDSVA